MCGIAGIIALDQASLKAPEAAARVLADAIQHRGPDGTGIHVRSNIVALNCRLAIVDIAGGEQPIYDRSGEIGIVFNGEIYNYREWREKLIARGYEFKTHSDTEVILHLYQELGEKAFDELEGMFAFCIWDERSGTTYIGRDAFGMKPLYLYEDGGRLVFASEIGAITALGDTDLPLSSTGLSDYLTFRYIAGTNTIYRSVSRLAPGTYLKIRDGRSTTHSFSSLTTPPTGFAMDFEEAKRELRSLLLTSVSSHLIGEAPIAMLLSGGVDSSIVAVLLRELGVRMEAFNVGFANVNEFEFSSAVAESCGFKLHNVEISPDALVDRMDDIILALDEPVADPACWPLYLLCEHIRPYAKVVLSGEGADELFGGYPQYKLATEPTDTGDLFTQFNRRSWYFLDGHTFLQDKARSSYWRRFEKYFRGNTVMQAMSAYDFRTWVPEDLMMKADKILMRHSLEGRFPFLNRELYAFSRRIPDNFKINAEGVSKSILKEAFRSDLPDIVLDRPKMGFSVPTADILRAAKDVVLDTVAKAADHEEGEFLNMELIQGLFARWYADDRGTSEVLRLWTLFVLLRWLSVQRDAGRNRVRNIGLAA
jgi:asparagine synthase (glutamine-hydrolysing)